MPTDSTRTPPGPDTPNLPHERQGRRTSRDRRAPRDTLQRRAVLAALSAAGGFRSAQALHDQIRGGGQRIGLTTIYRVLHDLVRDGTADTVRGEDGQQLFRLTRSSGHHHHLVCRGCGHSIEVVSDVVEHWAASLAAEHGFTDLDHAIDLFGLCTECRHTETTT
ncbi:Fur family transcriptional regulator [Protofrankia symbiont of Coriaria ruscifolia]|uniref:Transcriptional repressor n=1 Tax=Candidatus Protofrankia californiensis TaxID=1839754 RepID=A0A1C3NYA1_9ACTN|nr:transcriptional repressor [Protofrankia symbiont of Coriaria ruscifolia]SBW22562.1 hypothetical protein FDG2_2814 [Candidatus Protofrankia californiensis]